MATTIKTQSKHANMPSFIIELYFKYNHSTKIKIYNIGPVIKFDFKGGI